MQTIKNESTESTTSNDDIHFSNTPAPANAMHPDCAPATDLDLPPTLGYWVEGQTG